VKALTTNGRLQLYLAGTLLLAALCPRSPMPRRPRSSRLSPRYRSRFPPGLMSIGHRITERGTVARTVGRLGMG